MKDDGYMTVKQSLLPFILNFMEHKDLAFKLNQLKYSA
uniref:Uncharacterized protein n=1 Tax=Rhizophora mucronata TaxID=61149 RepID=A0A2P2PXM2_RHIMU